MHVCFYYIITPSDKYQYFYLPKFPSAMLHPRKRGQILINRCGTRYHSFFRLTNKNYFV